jgi:hypothetical protein
MIARDMGGKPAGGLDVTLQHQVERGGRLGRVVYGG